MKKNKRFQLLVDPITQKSLLMRATFYWMTSLTLMGLLMSIQIGLAHSSLTFDEKFAKVLEAIGPAMLAALFLLPLFLFDCVRFSNRFAGPIRRIRGHLKQLAETGKTEELKIRQGDFWCDLAEEVNRVAERMNPQESR